ncbi:MAG TPA: class I SAM-dependent methyltransferase [Burkholderiaceae bacterium]|nr:class I SAM-dependent methyltransferase [Burkholderiaceae bacterium]
MKRRELLRWPLAAAAGSACTVAASPALAVASLVDLDTPYVTTPQPVVDAMLELAAVGPHDMLLDLGSGDGRIVITAAKRFGTRGLGVEIDPKLVALARRNAEREGVADKTQFVVQDLFDTDLSAATVITMYLLPDVNIKLRPRLQRLRPGTRIVSHDWDMGDWAPDRSRIVAAPGKAVAPKDHSRIMLWVIGN